MVYNYLPWPIVLVSYSTGNPYPEFVKPNNGPIKTTEKFTIGVRVEYSETNIRMNFDAIKPGGEHIPAGIWQEHGNLARRIAGARRLRRWRNRAGIAWSAAPRSFFA